MDNIVDKPVDILEISEAARFMKKLEDKGITLVNQQRLERLERLKIAADAFFMMGNKEILRQALRSFDE